MKDYFSNQSAHYAKFRPVYPPQLFDYILGYVDEKKLAWDCGTGNGQTAVVLAKYFDKVYATDISQNQILHALKKSNIMYSVEPAEKTTLADKSVNLITVSQALHWFELDLFYKEVKRVAARNGIIAVWTYPLMKADPFIDEIITDFYSVMLKDYWDKERKYVDEEYKTIPFPFIELPPGNFQIEVNWILHDMEGYLNTWSALQKYISINNENPVPSIIHKMKKYWKDGQLRKIIFPVHLKIGEVH